MSFGGAARPGLEVAVIKNQLRAGSLLQQQVSCADGAQAFALQVTAPAVKRLTAYPTIVLGTAISVIELAHPTATRPRLVALELPAHQTVIGSAESEQMAGISDIIACLRRFHRRAAFMRQHPKGAKIRRAPNSFAFKRHAATALDEAIPALLPMFNCTPALAGSFSRGHAITVVLRSQTAEDGGEAGRSPARMMAVLLAAEGIIPALPSPAAIAVIRGKQMGETAEKVIGSTFVTDTRCTAMGIVRRFSNESFIYYPRRIWTIGTGYEVAIRWVAHISASRVDLTCTCPLTKRVLRDQMPTDVH